MAATSELVYQPITFAGNYPRLDKLWPQMIVYLDCKSMHVCVCTFGSMTTQGTRKIKLHFCIHILIILINTCIIWIYHIIVCILQYFTVWSGIFSVAELAVQFGWTHQMVSYWQTVFSFNINHLWHLWIWKEVSLGKWHEVFVCVQVHAAIHPPIDSFTYLSTYTLPISLLVHLSLSNHPETLASHHFLPKEQDSVDRIRKALEEARRWVRWVNSAFEGNECKYWCK